MSQRIPHRPLPANTAAWTTTALMERATARASEMSTPARDACAPATPETPKAKPDEAITARAIPELAANPPTAPRPPASDGRPLCQGKNGEQANVALHLKPVSPRERRELNYDNHIGKNHPPKEATAATNARRWHSPATPEMPKAKPDEAITARVAPESAANPFAAPRIPASDGWSPYKTGDV